MPSRPATGLVLAIAVLAGCSTPTSSVGSPTLTPPDPAITSAAAALPPSDVPAVRSTGKAVARAATRSSPTAARTSASAAAGCPLFPASNIWHARADRMPKHARSAAYVRSIGSGRHLHPDFGSGLIDGAPFGIPVTTVPAGQKQVTVRFGYAGESDRGPYPIPRNARIEGGASATGDRHVILHDPRGCRLYELFDAHRRSDGSWRAGSGAIWNLRSNALRRAGWTSADAAGLPIMAGMARYEEVAKGRIDHAIRITVPVSRKAYLWPARHQAGSSTSADAPPMGLRMRLKASTKISGLPRQARVVAQAMKTYGVVVADNGSPWFITGTQDSRWDNDQLNALKRFTGGDFEAVDASGLRISADSGRARQP